MLPPAHRLTDPAAYRAAGRRGVRGASRTLVVHVLDPSVGAGPVTESVAEQAAAGVPPEGVRIGFVVSKAVGGAVVRNRVKRRLRHLVREELLVLAPAGSRVVVRALPASAEASSGHLRRDLVRAWQRAVS